VTESICLKTAIIWSRKFARLNENRTKKSKIKSTKFSSRFRSFESQSNTLKKSQEMTWKRQENRELRRWIDADVERNHSKCLICRDICRRKNLIQADQLLNAEQRNRHSCIQRFRSISTESSDWSRESANNR
jgi:1,4-alpha-glucan branching enzyme